jgi:hypothetical protein
VLFPWLVEENERIGGGGEGREVRGAKGEGREGWEGKGREGGGEEG